MTIKNDLFQLKKRHFLLNSFLTLKERMLKEKSQYLSEEMFNAEYSSLNKEIDKLKAELTEIYRRI